MAKGKDPMTAKNIIRLLVVPWYLLGWISHVWLGLSSPETYRAFGSTSLFPAYTDFWNGFIMPNILFFALLLAAFEITVGCLLSSKGKWVKIGLVFSFLFNLFLIQMGLGFVTSDPWSSFAGNRLANLLFIALQIPLLRGDFDKSLPAVMIGWFQKSKAANDSVG
jgi:hypothetical protein